MQKFWIIAIIVAVVVVGGIVVLKNAEEGTPPEGTPAANEEGSMMNEGEGMIKNGEMIGEEKMMEEGSAMMKQEAAVTYTESGFSPATLTVKAGTTVIFKNMSSGSMWVASAFHPTHQELPGFDQKTSAPKGGTYKYTFTKAGPWGYHNHANPSARGTIIVQ